MGGLAIQQKMSQTTVPDQEAQAQCLNMAARQDLPMQVSYGQMPPTQWVEIPSNMIAAVQKILTYGSLEQKQQQVLPPPPREANTIDGPKMPELSMPPPSVPPPPLDAAPLAPSVLSLAEAIAPPELGGPQLPSIGSMLHHKGGCRPCTFFHTRGCENKEDCKFCHLCGPGEKKKRLKQLKAAQREATFIALENAKATLASYNDYLPVPEGSNDEDMII